MPLLQVRQTLQEATVQKKTKQNFTHRSMLQENKIKSALWQKLSIIYYLWYYVRFVKHLVRCLNARAYWCFLCFCDECNWGNLIRAYTRQYWSWKYVKIGLINIVNCWNTIFLSKSKFYTHCDDVVIFTDFGLIRLIFLVNVMAFRSMDRSTILTNGRYLDGHCKLCIYYDLWIWM